MSDTDLPKCLHCDRPLQECGETGIDARAATDANAEHEQAYLNSLVNHHGYGFRLCRICPLTNANAVHIFARSLGMPMETHGIALANSKYARERVNAVKEQYNNNRRET